MAEYWKIQGDELQDLAMCALLHDNALTQYISEELKKDSVIDCKKDLSEKKTNLHCIYGEKNITKIPFKTDVSNVILYHHEHADGTGPFQKKWNEIPLFARIIHLADTIDIIGNNMESGNNSWNQLFKYADEAYELLHDEFTPDKYDRIDIILENLRNYTVKHFSDEEQYMESINYKKIFTQKVQHQEFIHKLDEFMEHHNDEVEDQDEQIMGILKYLTEWLVNHILYVDGQIPKG